MLKHRTKIPHLSLKTLCSLTNTPCAQQKQSSFYLTDLFSEVWPLAPVTLLQLNFSCRKCPVYFFFSPKQISLSKLQTDIWSKVSSFTFSFDKEISISSSAIRPVWGSVTWQRNHWCISFWPSLIFFCLLPFFLL